MNTHYPHPILAREGWPFIALAVALAAFVTWGYGPGWAAPLWLIALSVVQFFRDPPRAVPAGGAVERTEYFAGKFFNADLDKASEHNERNAVLIRTPQGKLVTCVQVAGLIARRVLCYVKGGDSLARGQHFGFVRFGSPVDVYLPPGSRPLVSIGDRVSATPTVLAEL